MISVARNHLKDYKIFVVQADIKNKNEPEIEL